MSLEPLSRILVGIDLSKASMPLGEFAIRVASMYGSELIFAYVVEDDILDHPAAGFDPEKIISSLVEEAKELLGKLVHQAITSGVRAKYKIIDTPTNPALGLDKLANEVGASEIMVSHKGRRLLKIIPLGSVAMSLIGTASVPVIIAKPSTSEGDEEFKVRLPEGAPLGGLVERVVVAVADVRSAEMVEYAVELARRAKTSRPEIFIVHVIEPNSDEATAKKIVNAAAETARSRGVEPTTIILEGHKPWRDILAAAEQLEATSIVVGRSTKKGIREIILGSTLNRIVDEAKIPVIVYPLEKEG